MSSPTKKRNDLNWANLPEDLLDDVLDRLVDVPDYVRFSVVCKHWLSTAQLHHKQFRLKPSSQKQQLPMLLVHNGRKDYRLHIAVGRDDTTAAKFHLPDYYTNNMQCCGSSHGWLIFIHKEKHGITLFNPFTKATNHLPPPPIFEQEHWIGRRIKNIKYVKVVLSEDPSLCPGTYQVLALCSNLNTIWLFRASSDSWFVVNLQPLYLPGSHISLNVWMMRDAIYYGGKFYIIGSEGQFIMVEAAGDSSAPRCVIIRRLVLEQHPDSKLKLYEQYLAESSSNGCLLYIEMGYYGRAIHDESNLKFRVYKVNLNHDDEDPMCSVLLSLGGETLFLGLNRSLSFLASKFSGCQPDCIYYTGKMIKNDIGVYDIVGGRFAKPLDLTGALTPPIWIVPEANLNIT